MGFKITIFTSRNMKTFQGDTEKIKAHTLPQIVTWLEKNQIPYDELVIGKPWCGEEGFYVDDKAIRPSEFASLEYDEITALLSKENCHNTNKIAGGGIDFNHFCKILPARFYLRIWKNSSFFSPSWQ